VRALARAFLERLDRDRVFDVAAEIAFYFLFAAQPLLIVLATVLAYLPVSQFEPRILSLVTGAFPGEVGEHIAAVVRDVLERKNPGLLSAALVTLLWSASSGTKQLIRAVATANGAGPDERPWWRIRLRALVVTIALVVLAAVGGALAAGALHIVTKILEWGDAPALASWAERALGFILVTAAVQLIYRYGRPVKVRGPELPGAVAAVLAALGAGRALSIYARDVANLNAVYGSLAAIVLLMLWFYVVALALLLGAEVNAWLATRRASRRGRGGVAPQPA
jgi:membrane protein